MYYIKGRLVHRKTDRENNIDVKVKRNEKHAFEVKLIQIEVKYNKGKREIKWQRHMLRDMQTVWPDDKMLWSIFSRLQLWTFGQWNKICAKVGSKFWKNLNKPSKVAKDLINITKVAKFWQIVSHCKIRTEMHVEEGLNNGVSVTRLGDILDFGQLFKAWGNN